MVKALGQAVRFLNVLDGCLTLHIYLNIAQDLEWNPIMGWLLTIGPVAFIIGKMCLITFATILLEEVKQWLVLALAVPVYVAAVALNAVIILESL
jgi:hypothetical protein